MEAGERACLCTYSKVVYVLIAFLTQASANPPSPRQDNAIVTKNTGPIPNCLWNIFQHYSFYRSPTQLHFISNS